MVTKRWAAGFVWRGPAPWETDRQPSYHVEIGEYVETSDRGPVILGEPQAVTAEQAAALGFPISSLVEGISGRVLNLVQELAKENMILREEIARLQPDTL